MNISLFGFIEFWSVVRFILLFLFSSVLLCSEWVTKPRVASRVGFDSNMLRQEEEEVKFLLFRISPGILINNKNDKENSIALDADIGYVVNVGVNSSSTFNENVLKNSNWFASLGLEMAFFKTGHFSPFVSNDMKKMSYYSYSSDIEKFDNIFSIGFDTVPFGRALNFRLEYSLIFHKTIFKDDLTKNTKFATEAQDNLGHDISLSVDWAFLPKTSFLFTFKYFWLFHPNNRFVAYDSNGLVGTLGLKGVITPKLSSSLILGWNFTMFDGIDSFNGLVATFSLNYFFSEKNNIKFSYTKNMKDVIFANYLSYHVLTLVWNSKIMNNFSFQLLGRGTLYMFSNFNSNATNYTNNSNGRTDFLLSISPSLSYTYKNIQLKLKYIMDKNFTDFTTTFNGTENIGYSYIKHQIFLDFIYSF